MEIDKDLALLYGILAGDGCLSKVRRKNRKNSFSYFVGITCNKYCDQHFVDKIVLPLLEKIRGRKTNIRTYSGDGTIRILFCDKKLYSFLRKLGFPNGVKGNKIIIPKVFYKKKLVKYAIQGYFATDGCFCLTKNPKKYYPRIESRSTNLRLLQQIHKFLNKLGLNGHYYSVGKNIKRGKNEMPVGRFQFNGNKNLELFRENIGFVNYKHELRYNKFNDYLKIYENGREIDYNFNMALPGFEPGIPAT